MERPHVTLAAPPLSWEVTSYLFHRIVPKGINLTRDILRRPCLERLSLLLSSALVGLLLHFTTITGAFIPSSKLSENLNLRKESKGVSPSLRAAQLYESVRIRPVVVEAEVMPQEAKSTKSKTMSYEVNPESCHI